MNESEFLKEHGKLTRRYFGRLSIAAASIFHALPPRIVRSELQPKPPATAKAGVQPDPYFTPTVSFRDVSRGKPLPHSLPEEQKHDVGLTRETWRLEVRSDTEHPSKLGKEFTHADDTAINFERLLELAETHAVRFPKIMTCLNLGCPLGMGLWEGVPLREVIWLTQPKENLRRVFYYGYHNDDPKQIFRSSLPIGRVLEDPYDLPPVILCYKLNGEWLDSERGGPVRIVVPEAYGFKSVKWLTHVVLTNAAFANDTYAEQNNDIDSPLKTFAATLSVPEKIEPGKPIPVSGYAQVGISGLKKVQVAIENKETSSRPGDPYFLESPWIDADLLARPLNWGAVDEKLLSTNTHGFNANGDPMSWPLRFTKAHWAAILAPQTPGDYLLRCRAIDEKGHAQPLPRPFRKSGHAAIESVPIRVES